MVYVINLSAMLVRVEYGEKEILDVPVLSKIVDIFYCIIDCGPIWAML